MKKIDFNTKEKLIALAGACFWYWNNFYSFLETCDIPSSIYKQFGKENKYQVMRSILELLERQERYDLIENIAREFCGFSPSEENIDKIKANKLINELRESVGGSFVQSEIKKKEQEKIIENSKKVLQEKLLSQQKIEELKQSFFEMFTCSDKQKRGYDLEKLFFQLLEIEEIENTKPYKNTGEQIDGHFKYEKFDYLVEVKWTDEVSKQSDLSIFDGKIKGKAQSTRGLFFSINGFDDNSITKFSGDSPRIILMNGEDLTHVLEARITFFDLMKSKVDNLVRKGLIYSKYE
ncbi:MAG: restriction endonuclease [Candidatus Paceibacterota bacterium]|jgi:restriction endonuclease Mrr